MNGIAVILVAFVGVVLAGGLPYGLLVSMRRGWI